MKRLTIMGVLVVLTIVLMLSPGLPLGIANDDTDSAILFSLAGPRFDKTLISIDPNTAATSVIGKVGTGFDLEGMTFNPDNGFLYGSTGWKNPGGPALIRIDPCTGAGETVGLFGGDALEIDALSFHPITGVLYGVDEIGLSGGQLYTINIDTGAATFVGNLGYSFGVGDPGIAFDSTGILYGVDRTNDWLFTINTTTGGATGIGPLGFDDINGLDFNPDTDVLFGLDQISSELITIDTTTGHGTLVGVLTGPVTELPVALAFMLVEISATLDIDPDTLNLKSNGEWITAYIELPEGYSVGDINVSSILLNGTIFVDPSAPTQIEDYDGDGTPDLMVKFDRATVIAWLDTSDYDQETEKSYEVTLTITGKVVDTPFEGVDTVRVLSKG